MSTLKLDDPKADRTMDAALMPDQNFASQLALRVALQTMKERCILLQKRLTAVEEENQDLRDRLEADSNVRIVASNTGNMMEIYQLRSQVADLSRQKLQLSEHINMVSAENRKLWSRLSQMAKEQNTDSGLGSAQADKDKSYVISSDAPDNCFSRGGNSHLNLTRSRTFTQHSPNPNLRHKVLTSCAGNDARDASMEDVTLDAFEHHQTGAGEAYAVEPVTDSELGFSYLNVEGSGIDDDSELNGETKKCFEGFEEMQREALLQQQELNAALRILRAKMANKNCRECEKKSQKPEMADKSLETDENPSEMTLHDEQKALFADTSHSVNSTQNSAGNLEAETHQKMPQEKMQADELDKICPMCGKVFPRSVSFDAFREHVETHFIDDSSDVETSMERNFEFISHTMGNF